MSTTPTAMTPASPPPRGAARREAIARLKQEIARIEAHGATEAPGTTAPGPVTFGIAAIDGHLPGGGLATGAVHEIIAGDGGMAATGLALVLTARLFAVTKRRHWLWCGRELPPYGPGLAALGCDPAAAIVVRGASDREALWAMEEGLATPALAAVIGELGAFDDRAGRRLALAARESGVTAFVLRGGTSAPAPTVAATRWRVRGIPLGETAPIPPAADAPGDGTGYAWQLDFLRGGGAMPRSWRLLWRPARPAAAASPETWPENHDGEDDNDTGPAGAPPGALSLAAPLRGGARAGGAASHRRRAG